MSVTRRSLIKSGLAGVAALNANFSWADETPVPKRKGRVHQSVCRWCYPDISLDKLCEYGAKIGLSGVDLLQPDEYEVPRRYGLVCTMGLIPGVEIPEGYNRLENHARLEDGLRK
jgi:hydroxypyruvate isomerase